MLTQLHALQREFSQLSYHLVPRSGNKAAKTMVGYSKENNEPSFW